MAYFAWRCDAIVGRHLWVWGKPFTSSDGCESANGHYHRRCGVGLRWNDVLIHVHHDFWLEG